MKFINNRLLYNWQIFNYDVVTSTNDVAMHFAAELSHRQKQIFIARYQTAGRGRRGRNWISPQGNLYMSQLMEWNHPANELVYITSLSIIQTLRSFAPQLDWTIKWPNDILLNGAKVCGILIEKTPQDNVIIGIGINLQTSPAIDEVIYPTTDLAANNCHIDIDKFLNTYLPIFDHNCQSDFTLIRHYWLRQAYNLGNIITINKNTKNRQSGRFIGIDEQGNLLLQQQDNITTITTGEITN